MAEAYPEDFPVGVLLYRLLDEVNLSQDPWFGGYGVPLPAAEDDQVIVPGIWVCSLDDRIIEVDSSMRGDNCKCINESLFDLGPESGVRWMVNEDRKSKFRGRAHQRWKSTCAGIK